MTEKNVLIQFLKNNQISQKQLAQELGYHPQYISNLVVGQSPVTNAFIGRIAIIYGSKEAEIFFPYLDTKLSKNN